MTVSDYQPRTTLQRVSCDHLAGVLEQLEVLKPGSSEHQRLVQLSLLLGEKLAPMNPEDKADRITEVRRVIAVSPQGTA